MNDLPFVLRLSVVASLGETPRDLRQDISTEKELTINYSSAVVNHLR
jgi:hypothetical protein